MTTTAPLSTTRKANISKFSFGDSTDELDASDEYVVVYAVVVEDEEEEVVVEVEVEVVEEEVSSQEMQETKRYSNNSARVSPLMLALRTC
jgi:hypothetical protein